MNQTSMRRVQLRNLARRVEHARAAIARQTSERDSAIGRNGAAHPQSIRAGRTLTRTETEYRALDATYRRRRREDAAEGR